MMCYLLVFGPQVRKRFTAKPLLLLARHLRFNECENDTSSFNISVQSVVYGYCRRLHQLHLQCMPSTQAGDVPTRLEQVI